MMAIPAPEHVAEVLGDDWDRCQPPIGPAGSVSPAEWEEMVLAKVVGEYPIEIVGGHLDERIGCWAREVNPPPGATGYPWTGRRTDEVVILIKDDPALDDYGIALVRELGWSCVMDKFDLRYPGQAV
jgi:hypothetical protein